MIQVYEPDVIAVGASERSERAVTSILRQRAAGKIEQINASTAPLHVHCSHSTILS